MISYLKKHGITQIPEKVDIEGIANSLGLKVCYESIAERIGVSYTALMIRLRQFCLLDYRPLCEYTDRIFS